MAEKTNESAGYDPRNAWQEVRDAWVESWAKVMAETVNTEAYAKATGALLDSYLTASIPVREAVKKVMLSSLAQFSMPSRADITSLAERLTNLEMRLDDMDAKLERIERAVSKPAVAKSAPGSKNKKARA